MSGNELKVFHFLSLLSVYRSLPLIRLLKPALPPTESRYAGIPSIAVGSCIVQGCCCVSPTVLCRLWGKRGTRFTFAALTSYVKAFL